MEAMEKNLIIFGVDMSSSVHFSNKGKDIFIFSEGPTQGLDNTALKAEAKYPINFAQSGKRFVLSLHYKGSNNLLFVNAAKVYQFKSKDSEIKNYAPYLGNVSKYFKINNMKKKKNRIKELKKLNLNLPREDITSLD